METTLLQNIRRTQAFDAAQRRNKRMEKLILLALWDILLQPNPTIRMVAIANLERQLVGFFRETILPAAQKIGIDNARRVLSATDQRPRLVPAAHPTPPVLLPSGFPDFQVTDSASGLSPTLAHRTAQVDAAQRPADRAAIIALLINDLANTLQNRLAAFWLEPGPTIAQRAAELRQQHAKQQQARREYDAALDKYQAGETDVRPRRPKLQYLDAFAEGVREEMRVQARRAAVDAEIMEFARRGYQVFSWMTVNGPAACPDCIIRQGVQGDRKFWDQWGWPGSGRTICGANCFCLVIPTEAYGANRSLHKGLKLPRRGVLTSPDDIKKLREQAA